MKKKLNSSAKEIAKHGRYGDDRLLHVSQTELDGLASLVPGGKLPINPDTGLPEAFFFLPFLAALGGAAAAPAAAAGTAALTAGLTAAAAPVAAAAVPAATAATGAGLTAAAMPALTAAGDTALTTLGTAGASGLPAALAGTPMAGIAASTPSTLAAMAPTTAASALPTAAGAGGLAGLPTTAAAETMKAGLFDAAANSGITTAMNATNPALNNVAGTMVASNGPVAVPTTGAQALQNLSTPVTGTVNPAPNIPRVLGDTPFAGYSESLPGKLVVPQKPIPGIMGGEVPKTVGAATPNNPVTTASKLVSTPATMTDGLDAIGAGSGMPTGKEGGLGSLFGDMDMNKMLMYGALGSMMLPRSGGGGGKKEKPEKVDAKQFSRGEQAAPPDGGANGGITNEWNYFPDRKYYGKGGMVNCYADGGKVYRKQFPDSELLSDMEIADDTDGFHNGKVGGIAYSVRGGMGEYEMERRIGDAIRAANNKKHYAEGGLASLDKSSTASGDDEQLIDATVAAIQGQMPNAQQIIQLFVQTFGPEALQHLVQEVQAQQGQSDGLSDSVPAQIQGLGGLSQPAQLSEGEYVVPSDVVSHLGNGSSTAGERQLNDMVNRTRQARGAQAPVAIDPSQVMPA